MTLDYDPVLDELTVTEDTDRAIGVFATSMTWTFAEGPLEGRQVVDPVVLVEIDQDARTSPIVVSLETARTLAAKLLAAAAEAEAAPLHSPPARLRVVPDGGDA